MSHPRSRAGRTAGAHRRALPTRRSTDPVARLLATEPGCKPSQPCNLLDDLAPVSLAETGPYLLVANPSLPVRDVGELIAFARANRGRLDLGPAGMGSSGHLIGEIVALRAGIQAVHVPHRGGGQARQFARPGWSISFHPDPDAAAQSRLRLLAMAATDRITVAGSRWQDHGGRLAPCLPGHRLRHAAQRRLRLRADHVARAGAGRHRRAASGSRSPSSDTARCE